LGFPAFSFLPYDKFFIDQICSAKVAEYWPRSFLRFIDLDKELGQYTASAILTSRLVDIKHKCVANRFLFSLPCYEAS